MDPPLSWSNRMQKNASSFPPSLPLMICVNGCAIITANILDLQIRAIMKKKLQTSVSVLTQKILKS